MVVDITMHHIVPWSARYLFCTAEDLVSFTTWYLFLESLWYFLDGDDIDSLYIGMKIEIHLRILKWNERV